jgi:hypothetical protein
MLPSMTNETEARLRLIEHYRVTLENAHRRVEDLRVSLGAAHSDDERDTRRQLTRWERIVQDTQMKLDRVRAAMDQA